MPRFVVPPGDRSAGWFDPARRACLGLIGLGGASLMAGCVTTEGARPSQGASPTGTQGPPLGTGAVTVALLVPLSAGGGGGAVGTGIRNACDMAIAEFAGGDVRLVVKDDLGTPAGARAAADSALAEGARVILGPLFGPSVAAAGEAARRGGVPMVAFSSDASVAASGIYLLSFMPQSDVDRIVGHAAAGGKRSFAALVPRTAYGAVVQGELQVSASRNGIRIAALADYPADQAGMQEPVARIAGIVKSGQADALFLPEGGDTLPLLVQALASAGVDPKHIQLLGTGVWDDRRVFADPMLQGGLYAAPDSQGFQAFAARYRARFGASPVRLASVGYDAVSLVTALLKTYGPGAFDPSHFAAPTGFNGVDGAFRFRADGTNERSLAVLRVTPGGGETVSPAAGSFVS